MKKAMIMQMVINVVDEDGEGHSAPELLDISLGVCSMLTDCIDDFGVGVFGGLTYVHAKQCCRGDVHESAPGGSIESTNQRDRDPVAVDQSCRRRIDAGSLGELHRQDLAPGDRPFIINAGKLANVKSALFVDDGTLGSQPAQRCSSPAKVS